MGHREWNDTWVGQCLLRSYVHGPLPLLEDSRSVDSIITNTRGWDFGNIPLLLSSELWEAIRGIPIYSSNDCEDHLVLGHSRNGFYSAKSAYKLLLNSPNPPPLGKWSWIWKCLVISKIQHLIWLCCHEKLATRAHLAAIGIPVDPSCPICHCQEETIQHILRVSSSS
ncbi:hypothetical protein CDL15_Pgr004348 [Punica granatum]|uniref:Reverse transcriptase zinc-binding domain-containing protein n=1 Tax=Punica granatum TaxID=22663 RepID=A0A218XG26_PUNGR|nr:hypothetical protein CDL15_Pgr004348 [Punica granatum]